ncbi:MAG: TetR family transcriptional regulator [Actinobacteria bacterium]|nr:TetR family transcriptional regulator [Actinomycetota bacterium]
MLRRTSKTAERWENLPMPKIQASNLIAHRELRREQLMAAAMELAVNEGAQAITVAAVASKAGLSRSSIYEYFSSSADLVADLVIEELEHYSNRLAEAIKGVTDPYEMISLWIEEGLRYVVDGRHMLVKSLNTVTPPEFRKEEIAVGHRNLLVPLRNALAATGISDIRGASAFLSSVTDAASVRIESGNDAELEIRNAKIFAVAGLRALAQ